MIGNGADDRLPLNPAHYRIGLLQFAMVDLRKREAENFAEETEKVRDTCSIYSLVCMAKQTPTRSSGFDLPVGWLAEAIAEAHKETRVICLTI